MTDESTLRKYISNALSDNSVKQNADTYEEWLAVNKKTGEKELTGMMEKAFTDHMKAASSYGKNAEALASLGLSESGYADYIDAMAKKSLYSTAGKINAVSDEDAFENLQGYAKYLMDISKNLRTRKDSLISQFAKENRPGRVSAYKMAIEYGFSEEDARELAELADSFSLGTISGKSSVISTIMGKGLDYDEAYRYALACGFGEEESHSIASASTRSNGDEKNTSSLDDKSKHVKGIKDIFWDAVFKTVFNK